MEENNNNNNDNKVMDQIKDTAKNETKKLGKKVATKLIKWAWPVISTLLLILLALGFINYMAYLIRDIFTSSPDDQETTSTNDVQNIVYIDDSGAYKLKKNFSEEILARLEELYVSNNAMGFLRGDLENLEDMIDVYVKADLQMMLPYTGHAGNEVDGKIKIQRKSPSGDVTTLQYKEYEAFKSIEGSADSLKYFSINPETFKLCIARRNSYTEITYYDMSTNTTGGGIETEEKDYLTSIQNYGTPFNFFISLHLIAQDDEFMKELVDMVTREGIEDPIILTLIESQVTNKIQIDYSGTRRIEKQEIIHSNTREVPDVVTTISDYWITIDNNNITEYTTPEPEYWRKVEVNEIAIFKVTKVDTWIKYITRKITAHPTGSKEERHETINVPRKEVIYGTENLGHGTIKYYKDIYHATTIDKKIVEESSGNTYSISDDENETKIQDFIDLIKEYTNVVDNLTTASSNLFYFLQQSESTQKHEQIMKYVIYQLSGINYGVDLDDVDNLLDSIFSGMSNGASNSWRYGGSVEAQVWFGLRNAGYSQEAVAGVMGNIDAECGFNPDLIEAGNGIGYGLCQWSFGRRVQLETFAANKGASPSDVQTQLEFMLAEMTPEDIEGNMAEDYCDFQFNSVADYERWKDAPTPEEAAAIFCWTFERPNAEVARVETWRQPAARRYYEEFVAIEEQSGTFTPDGSDPAVKGYYTSSRGLTFTVLNQMAIPNWHDRCNKAAGAIIASAYSDETADELVATIDNSQNTYGWSGSPTDIYYNLYGLHIKEAIRNHTDVEECVGIFREQLLSGGYVTIWLNNGGTYYGKSGMRWTSLYHWVAIVDYRVVNGHEEIMVLDYRGADWYPIDEYQYGVETMRLISEM